VEDVHDHVGFAIQQNDVSRNQHVRGIQEVAVVAFARVLQDRVGAVSGVPAGACRALRVASPTRGAADFSWQARRKITLVFVVPSRG